MVTKKPPQAVPYLTNVGAAERKGLSEGAIREAIKRGDLTPLPTACGRLNLLSVAQVDRWNPPGGGRPKKKPGRGT